MTNFDKLINGDKPVLVDFSAEWCGPCKMMPPILSEVKKKVGDKATIIKLDIDKNPAYANQYGVQAVPTLILFNDGNVVWRSSGVIPAKEIMKHIDPLILAG